MAAVATWYLKKIDGDIALPRLVAALFLATASHGALDAMTDGGLGVAFFAPFDPDRYFFPWRPIRVSPISIGRFFSPRGLAILENEARVVWIPAAALWLTAIAVRRGLRR